MISSATCQIFRLFHLSPCELSILESKTTVSPSIVTGLTSALLRMAIA